MKDYKNFVERLLLNYIIGSLLAIFGIGGVTMFVSLNIGMHEKFYLFFILIFSISIMFSVEAMFFRSHLKPIKKAFEAKMGSNSLIEKGLIQLHQFPVLSVKRIMLPHFLSFSLPATFLSIILIEKKILIFPFEFVGYAFFSAFLVAAMHALIEYFLTIRAVHPAIDKLKAKLVNESTLLPEREVVRVPIRIKMSTAIVLIGVFPVFLFLLSAHVKLREFAGMDSNIFWNWGLSILAITIFYSVLISRIMSMDLEKPIHQLQQMMKDAETQNYVMKENVYTDEFSDLFYGFNKMIVEIQKQNEKNDLMVESFLTVLSAALDARDSYTSGHSLRVANFSKMIGQAIGLSSNELELLYKTSLLHDIGKIGVPDSILLKEGRLTDEEFEKVKRHPEIGENILKQVKPLNEISEFLPGVRSHHERIDGKGYPDGLVGHQIPLFGRIIAVADAYDAMTSDRPYRKGMPPEKAWKILSEGKGNQWDANLVDRFLEVQPTRSEKIF